jgi:hypothetical protein
VASCASAACHHGNGPPGSKGSEYTTWAARDPHARAYSVLFDERSREVVRTLKGLKEVRPEKEELCLSCHVLQDFRFKQTPRGERFALGDGVGCEACHGPAQKWLGTHYLNTWRGKGEGFVPTKDLGARAGVCVGCHVGRGDMDVNHNLIAAGHPRLRFDFGAYHAVYPKHWPEAADKKGRPDFEARAWLVGQLTSAEAALQLLEYRASNAGKTGGPWPEFAEYECAGCHHSLKEPSGRPRRGPGGRPAGSLPWGGWYYALLPTLARHTPGGPAGVGAALEGVGGSMRARLPAEGDVARGARAAAGLVGRWRAKVGAGKGLTAAQVRALLDALAREERLARSGWDAAAQLYLGVAALNQGLGDLAPRHRERPGLKEAIRGMGRQLEEAIPGGGNSLYDSPSDFAPDRLARQLQEIQKRLR